MGGVHSPSLTGDSSDSHTELSNQEWSGFFTTSHQTVTLITHLLLICVCNHEPQRTSTATLRHTQTHTDTDTHTHSHTHTHTHTQTHTNIYSECWSINWCSLFAATIPCLKCVQKVSTFKCSLYLIVVNTSINITWQWWTSTKRTNCVYLLLKPVNEAWS